MVGGVLLEQAIPFNRVWSFPKEIKVVNRDLTQAELDLINRYTQKYIAPVMGDTVFSPSPILRILNRDSAYI